MALYWILGTGNWSDTAHWSTSSGGVGGASIPTSSDDVYFDANSFPIVTGTVTIDVTASCKNINWTGALNTPTLNISHNLSIFGSATFIATMNADPPGAHNALIFASTSSGNTITSNGVTLANVDFNGVGGVWTLQDDVNISELTIDNGTLNTNGKTVNAYLLEQDGGTLNLGSSIVNNYYLDGSTQIRSSINFARGTVNAGTSTINVFGGWSFRGNGSTFNILNMYPNSSGATTIFGSNSFTTLNINLPVSGGSKMVFQHGSTQTCSIFNVAGNSSQQVILESDSASQTWTISASTVNSLAYLTVSDSIASGSANPFNAGTGSIDNGNNTNWVFLKPVLTTDSFTQNGGTSASAIGTVDSDQGVAITERGFVYATHSNPTTSDTKVTLAGTIGTMSTVISGLIGGATYHLRAYAINTNGTSYGTDLTFTIAVLPTVVTSSMGDIFAATATANGSVTNNGGILLTERGIVIGMSLNPTTSNTKYAQSGDTGSFSASLAGLTANTTYHVRAYATNIAGTSYGTDVQFTTANILTLKRFYYKVFSSNSAPTTQWDVAQWDVSTWDSGQVGLAGIWSSEVVSDPTFESVLNGGAGQLIVRLARKYDSFGEGVDVNLNNKVELWVSDFDAPQGVRIYTGYISAYAPVIDGNEEYIDVTLLGYVSETSYNVMRDGSNNTTITFSGVDVASAMNTAIGYYRQDGGVDFNAGALNTTGSTINYTFSNNTYKEVFDNLVSLSPNGWYWYMDPSTNVINLMTANLDSNPTHTLTIGKQILYLQTTKRNEDVVNRVLVIGGGIVPLYNQYSRSGSISSNGKHESKIQDGNVVDPLTADLLAQRLLDQYQEPETRSVIRILDNNGENQNIGYNIESIKPGDTIQVKNLNYGATSTTQWDIAQWDVDIWDAPLQYEQAAVLLVVKTTYYPDYVEIEASSRLPDLSKRIEQVILKELNTLYQQGLPNAPAIRTV